MARRWNKIFAKANQRDLKPSIPCQKKEVSEEKTNEKRTLDKHKVWGDTPVPNTLRGLEMGEKEGESDCVRGIGRGQGLGCKMIK